MTLMTANHTAELLSIHPNTLAKWRLSGEGPTFTKMGRSVRYRMADIEKWLEARQARSTSEGFRLSQLKSE